MNISSLIVRVRPQRASAVRAALSELPGVEVHTVTDDGRLVVTIEDTSTAAAADTYVRLHAIKDVASVAMIYQYSDESSCEEIRS